MSTPHLHAQHIRTMERIHQHPVSHNLEWHDVIALVRHLGTVEETGDGHVTLTIGDVSQKFHRSAGKDVSETQQVLDIRHFLDRAGVGQGAATGSSTP